MNKFLHIKQGRALVMGLCSGVLWYSCNAQEKVTGRTMILEEQKHGSEDASGVDTILSHNRKTEPRAEVHNFNFEEGSLGVRNFEQLYSYMSRVTGVPESNQTTRNAFTENAGQLPSDNFAFSLTGAAQVNVTKMAAAFCAQAAADANLRTSNFGSLNFAVGPSQAFSQEAREQLFDHLASRFWGARSQVPPRVDRNQILNQLLNDMLQGVNMGAAVETRRAAEVLCTAVLSSLPGTVL